MTNGENRDFLKYVFNEYIHPRIHKIGREYDHLLMWSHWHYEWRGQRKSVDLINFINNHCDDNDDIYRTFTLE